MNIMRISPTSNFNIQNFSQVQNRNKTEKQTVNNTVKKTVSRASLPYFVSFYGEIKPANRLNSSPFLISKYIEEISKARDFHGNKSVVDMSMGNPDLLPPEKAKETLRKKINDVWSHRYNNPKGEGELFHTAGTWMKERFGVEVNPRTEVMVTSGASDAISTILDAYANPGDKILIPNPGYSLYDDLIVLKDLKKSSYPLDPENAYLPDFSKMPKDAKILIFNYPHNPTGSFATKKALEEAVKFAKENNILLIHDMDNSEVTHTGKKPMGIMQVEGAKDVAVEVHTMSKAQAMPGLRVAFVVSDKDNINNLFKAKLLSGSSVYTPVQSAAATALIDEEGYIQKVNEIYRNRKNLCIQRLQDLGCDAKATDGTYYLWAKIPEGFTSDEFVKYVLNKAQVAFTPGTVFGSNGEGFVRLVMSADEKIINGAFDRIKESGIRFDTPKSQLPKDVQKEIKTMTDDSYSITPKWQRDYDAYQETLEKRAMELSKKYQDKDEVFKSFIPKKENYSTLPWNILKDGQSVYLQNIKDGKSMFGEVKDLPAFSSPEEYQNLKHDLKTQWASAKYPDAEILPSYKFMKLRSDAYYFVLKTDDKIQALMNVEAKEDRTLWAWALNTAPWNQGENREMTKCGTAVMARAVSFCLETGNDKLRLATDKPQNVKFYASLGMKEEETQDSEGRPNTVMVFDKESMKLFLNKYQKDLAF